MWELLRSRTLVAGRIGIAEAVASRVVSHIGHQLVQIVDQGAAVLVAGGHVCGKFLQLDVEFSDVRLKGLLQHVRHLRDAQPGKQIFINEASCTHLLL